VNQIDVKFLLQFKTLSPFSQSQLEKLAANLAVKNLNKNETIFDQGDQARLIYLLLSGTVKTSYLTGNHKEVIVSLIPKGEFIGLDSLVPKNRHAFRCDAFDRCVVGAIKPQDFIEILLGVSFESFLRWYISAMDSGRKMYIHCIKGLGLDVRRRVALELVNLAERFGVTDPRGLLIAVLVSHEVLAGLVGGSRQHVTKQLNEFEREKIISRKGRNIIINVEKLSKVLA
jgi:CRP/FNR family cyclic AMP-dependent transcriptional regulator